MTLTAAQLVLEAFDSKAACYMYNQDNPRQANICAQFYKILRNTLADELTASVLANEIYESEVSNNDSQ